MTKCGSWQGGHCDEGSLGTQTSGPSGWRRPDCPRFSQQSGVTSQRRWLLGYALKDDQTLLHLGVDTVQQWMVFWGPTHRLD